MSERKFSSDAAVRTTPSYLSALLWRHFFCLPVDGCASAWRSFGPDQNAGRGARDGKARRVRSASTSARRRFSPRGGCIQDKMKYTCCAGYDRERQKSFYEKVDELLMPLAFSVQKFNQHGLLIPVGSRSLPASTCLSLCKINDEPSEPQRRTSVEALTQVETSWSALATAAAGVALFNHRTTVDRFQDALRKRRARDDKPVTRDGILETLQAVIRKRPLSKLFTKSFDKHATAWPDQQLVDGRMRKVRKIGLKRPDGALRGGKAGCVASRKSLSIMFGTTLSPLLGRNAFAYMERFFVEKACQADAAVGVPTWVKSCGTLMGEGALAGSNLLAGEIKNYNIHPGSTADVVRGFENSTISIKRLRKHLRKEIGRLQNVDCKGALRRMRDLCLEAGRELLNSTDTELEFLLCELSKVIEFAKSLIPNRRYLRQPPL